MATDISQTHSTGASTRQQQQSIGSQAGELEDRLTERTRNAITRLDARINQEQLTQGLGWFSIGLGLAELLAPRALGRAIGVGEHPTIIRLCGLRELASGVGLLSKRTPGAWAWSRVAGDAMDLALLNVAARSDGANTGRIAVAAGAVVGVTALDVYAGQRLRGVPGVETASIEVNERIIINSSPQVLYSFWQDVENLPRFMRHLESIQRTGERTSHWIATAPAGRKIQWDSEITEDEPNTRISWRTLPGSQVTHNGAVNFEALPNGRGSIVRVNLVYRPPAGRFGMQVARLFGEEPKQQIHNDLRRLKQLMETGEIATTQGQPSGRRSLIGRTALGRRLQ